jgi:hypothetical protein
MKTVYSWPNIVFRSGVMTKNSLSVKQVRQQSKRLQSIWSKNIFEYKFCTRNGTLKSSNQKTVFIGYDLPKNLILISKANMCNSVSLYS